MCLEELFADFLTWVPLHLGRVSSDPTPLRLSTTIGILQSVPFLCLSLSVVSSVHSLALRTDKMYYPRNGSYHVSGRHVIGSQSSPNQGSPVPMRGSSNRCAEGTLLLPNVVPNNVRAAMYAYVSLRIETLCSIDM